MKKIKWNKIFQRWLMKVLIKQHNRLDFNQRETDKENVLEPSKELKKVFNG